MDKAEAMSVLHEIYMACPEFKNSDRNERLDPAIAKISSLPNGFYELRIRCELDDESRGAIKPILEAHKLIMTEAENSIKIFREHLE